MVVVYVAMVVLQACDFDVTNIKSTTVVSFSRVKLERHRTPVCYLQF